MDIKEAISEIVEHRDLPVDAAADVMRQIMAGEVTPAQFGAFVTGLRMKGETAEEIAGMARSMRDVSLHVEFDGPTVDTCGTGGDGQKTFNISTTAAFVAAGAGAIVAKHGNRAMSSSSGSADALESLGVKIDLGPDGVKRCLEQVGMGFMFAQAFHPAMKFAGPLRQQIGIRTVFNLLGRLTTSYDLYLTQRLVLQPRTEINLSAQDAPEFALGTGFNDLSLELRLRYEMRREFAPYVGVKFTTLLGETANIGRRAGSGVDDLQVVFGLRIAF